MTRSVSPAAPHELMPALRLLSGRPESAPDAGGLFVARNAGGKVFGAVRAQALPGALGVVWHPRAASPADEDELVAAACGWLRSAGVKVCQAFATAGEQPAALLRNGFRHVTQLVFMRRDSSVIAPPIRPLTFTADAPPFSADFRAALLATHEDTRDCPELNAGRTPDEVVAGFADATPGTEWYLASAGESPLGVVVFAPEPDSDGVELSYLGVVPAERGRGWGGKLLKSVFSESRAAGVWLSVDARNEPALRLYRRHGFAETDRRDVLLASLDASGRGSASGR